MKRCGAPPYRGSEKYIFISYSHKDTSRVFPIIERLVRDGYRVWYDDGIDPGSEWPATIARHLKNCEVCIPLISKSSLKSANCTQEITYALSKNKKMFAVMLEEVVLPDGLEMQLSVIQSVFKYTQTDEEFFSRVYGAEILRPCLGEPNPKIRVSTPEEYAEDESERSGSSYSGRGSQRWMTSEERKENVKTDSQEARKNEEIKTDPREAEKAGGVNVNPRDNDRKRQTKKEADAAGQGRRKYLPPGYRTGKAWHMIIATCYYALMLVTAAFSLSLSAPENILFLLFFVLWFLACAAIWGNYLDCWKKIPLMKSRAGRILGFVIYPLLVYFVLAVLLSIALVAMDSSFV